MVPVSPQLAWRRSLPGTPDCCRRARPSDLSVFEAPRTTIVVSSFERRQWWRRSSGARPGWTCTSAGDCVCACSRPERWAGAGARGVSDHGAGLLALRDWLKAQRVTQVAMEATGVYWKPVWAIPEAEFDCLLVNARHVRQVPGRKTDVSDAAWLCQLLEAGLLQRSFVPPKPIRALRNLTRYRKAQIGERQREANRLHKILEDTGIKLDCVATDILGASGRAMLDALVAGTTDPQVLAELAKGKLRAKIPALRVALVGRFDQQHALIVSAILAHLDFLDEQIQLP